MDTRSKAYYSSCIYSPRPISQMWIYFFICILSIVYTCILKALWKTKASIKNTKFYLVLCFFYWRTFYFWDNLFMTTDYSAEPPGSEKLSSLIILNWHWNQSIREWITIIVIWFIITDFFSKVLYYLWFTFKSLCQFKLKE